MGRAKRRGGNLAVFGVFFAATGFQPQPVPERIEVVDTRPAPDPQDAVLAWHAEATPRAMSGRAAHHLAEDAQALLTAPLAADPASVRERLLAELHFLRYHPSPPDMPDYAERVEQALAKAEEIHDPHLAVTAKLVLAYSMDQGPDHHGGEVLATEAYHTAMELEDHQLAGQAAAFRAAYEHGLGDRFEHWVRTAEHHNDRIGGDPEIEMELAAVNAYMALDEGEFGEALIHWDRRLELSEDFLGPRHPMTGAAYDLRSTILHYLWQLDDAEVDIRHAIEIYEASPEVSGALAIGGRMELASLLFDNGAHATALQELDTARRLAEADRDAPNAEENLEYLHHVSAGMMRDLGHEEVALHHYLIVRDEYMPVDPYHAMDLYGAIAGTYLELGRRSDAIDAFETALTFTDPDAPEWEDRIYIRQRLAELRREAAEE